MTAGPRTDRERLLHRIRRRVSEAQRLRGSQGSEAALRAREREIDCLKEELAEAVRQDPAPVGWGRIRPAST